MEGKNQRGQARGPSRGDKRERGQKEMMTRERRTKGMQNLKEESAHDEASNGLDS